MSVMARFAFSAAASVSLPIDCSSDAENAVTVVMYSFALMPAVWYAFAAYCITVSAEDLNSVSTPPTSCSYSP